MPLIIADIGPEAIKIAKERKSTVLASNAVHHRIDSLTSIVALVAILGSHILENASWLDPVGGLAVSMLVVKAGWGNTGSALLELADVGVADDVKSSVREATTKALKGIPMLPGKATGHDIKIQDIQGVKAGQNYLMNIELAVSEQLSVKETWLIEDAVREKVGTKVRGVRRVRIRFVANNEGTTDFADEFISAGVSPRSSPEPEEERHDHIHESSHNDSHNATTLNGDVRQRR